MSPQDLLPFSSELKKYICSSAADALGVSEHKAKKKLDTSCASAFLSASLLYGGTFSVTVTDSADGKAEDDREVFLLRSENTAFLELCAFLLITLYDIDVSVLPLSKANASPLRILYIDAGTKGLKKLPDDLYSALKGANSFPAAHYCKAGSFEWFLRGVFVSCGTILDPKKGYHLELTAPDRYRADVLISILEEHSVIMKLSRRRGLYSVYTKSSGTIEDFITLIGAPSFAMELMQTKIEREIRNNVNRINNYDNANLIKTVDYSSKVIDAISSLRASGKYEELSEALKEAAVLRLDNPDATLRELCELYELSGSHITKSGLNHRLARLVSLAFPEPEKAEE